MAVDPNRSLREQRDEQRREAMSKAEADKHLAMVRRHVDGNPFSAANYDELSNDTPPGGIDDRDESDE